MNEKKIFEINEYVNLYNLAYKTINYELESLMLKNDLPVTLVEDLLTLDEIESVIKANTSQSINRVINKINGFDEIDATPYVIKFKNRLQNFVMEEHEMSKFFDIETVMTLENEVENIFKKELVLNAYGVKEDKTITLWWRLFSKINTMFYSDYVVKLAVIGIILSVGTLICTWRESILRSLFYLVTSMTTTGMVTWITFLPLSKIWIFKNLSTLDTAREMAFDVIYNYLFKELYDIGALVMMNGLILLIVLILIEQLKIIYLERWGIGK